MDNQTNIRKIFKENFGSFADIWLFIHIFFLVILTPLLLKLFSIPRVMKIFTPRYLKVYRDLDLKESKDKIVKFTDYILKRNFLTRKNICIKRSLIFYHFLRKMGINVYVCFGVRYNNDVFEKKHQKKLEGHAWLLHDGDIFLEWNRDVTKTYTMTYCFPNGILHSLKPDKLPELRKRLM